MMNFLKSLYRKLFGIKTGAYETDYILRLPKGFSVRPAYDPMTDENKIMNGEVESYFE